jgi:hypothetical protein
LDAVALEFDRAVAGQPWGRELHLVDPAGNRLRLGETHSKRVSTPPAGRATALGHPHRSITAPQARCCAGSRPSRRSVGAGGGRQAIGLAPIMPGQRAAPAM